MGFCGTGLGLISTLSSAAAPTAFIVHTVLLLFIQVMYCARGKLEDGDGSSERETQSRVEGVRAPLIFTVSGMKERVWVEGYVEYSPLLGEPAKRASSLQPARIITVRERGSE